MSLSPPLFAEVKDAANRILPYAHKTPVLTNSHFNKACGASLFFKSENFQKVGAFKFRGACNAVYLLSDDEAGKGVATHSSGNHGQAVALAAKLRGVPAHIVMPKNAPPVKISAVKEYGANVTLCEPTLKSRENTLDDIVNKTGATFIHPYNNRNVIAGQGTATLELIEQVPNLDIIITPVGGGGLLSGTAIVAKHLQPSIKVFGAEPEIANDAYLSFKSGKLIKQDGTDTIADGLRTSLGELTFEVIMSKVDNIVTVSESSIIRDMRAVWERMNMIIEPSCSVPLSAVLDQKIDCKGKRIGIILTGGNVDLNRLPWQKS